MMTFPKPKRFISRTHSSNRYGSHLSVANIPSISLSCAAIDFAFLLLLKLCVRVLRFHDNLSNLPTITMDLPYNPFTILDVENLNYLNYNASSSRSGRRHNR